MNPDDPLATIGAVAVDTAERTLTVMPAEPGYASHLFRRGYQRQVEAERRSRYGAPTIWAHGANQRDIARASRPAAHCSSSSPRAATPFGG